MPAQAGRRLTAERWAAYGEYTASHEYMAATTVRLGPELDARLNRLVQVTCRTKAFYLREMVELSFDNIEDAYLGAAALEEFRRSGEPAIPHEQVMREFGLAD